MLRFFVGLVLAQLVIAALVYFSPLSTPLEQVLLISFVSYTHLTLPTTPYV